MIPPHEFAKCFLETFDKSAIHVFRRWLERYPGTTKWIVAADFALRDKNRPGDCFGFTIFPCHQWPKDIEADIKSHLPRDLKDGRTLDATASQWMRSGRHFQLAVPMNRKRTFYGNGPGEKPAAVARESIRMTLEAMVTAERSADQIARLRAVLQSAQANSFNVGLFTDLTLLALYLPLVSLIIGRERKLDGIAWFCDRDSMISWGDGIVWDYANENYLSLAQILDIDVSGARPIIALPDHSSGKETMWYDDYIRPADWLAGTLAAWDRTTNQLPGVHDKYIRMVEDVIADADNIVILPVALDDRGLQVTLLNVARHPPAASLVEVTPSNQEEVAVISEDRKPHDRDKLSGEHASGEEG